MRVFQKRVLALFATVPFFYAMAMAGCGNSLTVNCNVEKVSDDRWNINGDCANRCTYSASDKTLSCAEVDNGDTLLNQYGDCKVYDSTDVIGEGCACNVFIATDKSTVVDCL